MEPPHIFHPLISGEMSDIMLVQQASRASPAHAFDLRDAASTTLGLIAAAEENKDKNLAYLSSDAAVFISAIWRSYLGSRSPQLWSSCELRDIIMAVTLILNSAKKLVAGGMQMHTSKFQFLAICVRMAQVEILKLNLEDRQTMTTAAFEMGAQEHAHARDNDAPQAAPEGIFDDTFSRPWVVINMIATEPELAVGLAAGVGAAAALSGADEPFRHQLPVPPLSPLAYCVLTPKPTAVAFHSRRPPLTYPFCDNNSAHLARLPQLVPRRSQSRRCPALRLVFLLARTPPDLYRAATCRSVTCSPESLWVCGLRCRSTPRQWSWDALLRAVGMGTV
ncbi:hypothetical protein HYPSUDRAFT_219585 [Hypholoma sublateritium FD-334 SS-4]|uniref:Uncharacterized protein n=1 Tax=Hypholoma sublateritium (strain FD-334 SS-4) TaxID=945553 RepID=A0A0D2KNH7_HYPSF|nr:hypothetical protein HYPSUDRAFT_219585 [Hypholoma sublateritium FD-334 SS-4]